MKFTKHILFFNLLLFCSVFSCRAQRVAISTNTLDWLNLGTVNLNVGVGFSRHFSFDAGAKYNGWSYNNPSGMPIMNKQKTAYVGLRYWPFYVNSGFWVATRFQYKDKTDTGIWRIAVEDAKMLGGSLLAGYDYLLAKHFNLEFGAGLWAGKFLDYTLYHCSNCMEVRETKNGGFIRPEGLYVSFAYVF